MNGFIAVSEVANLNPVAIKTTNGSGWSSQLESSWTTLTRNVRIEEVQNLNNMQMEAPPDGLVDLILFAFLSHIQLRTHIHPAQGRDGYDDDDEEQAN